MRTAIVWFKTDLRLHDNETLAAAVAENDIVLPVYCFDVRDYQLSPYGFQKTGTLRTQYLLQALYNLDDNLRQAGSGLLVVMGSTATELKKLVEQYNINSIYTAQEVAHDELARLKEVEDSIKPLHCTITLFSTASLYHPSDIPFIPQHTPDVFTAFRHKAEATCSVRKLVEKPVKISSPAIPALSLPHLQELNLTPITIDERAPLVQEGGESPAIQRMMYYFGESKLVSTYKQTRNQLLGSDYSTRFSAALAHGCLSPRYIYHSLKQYEQNNGATESSYWVVFELLWREYFRLMMSKYGTRYFSKQGISSSNNRYISDDTEALQKWINGKTGVGFVDANMLELKLTGHMSNRGRQNVASYLCNDLHLDWRLGAAYFQQQLIDYDVCSNWCNWAYIAGTGNDPRTNRYFNIEKQAAQYDPGNHYQKLWLT